MPLNYETMYNRTNLSPRYFDLRHMQNDKLLLTNPHKGWYYHYVDNGLYRPHTGIKFNRLMPTYWMPTFIICTSVLTGGKLKLKKVSTTGLQLMTLLTLSVPLD